MGFKSGEWAGQSSTGTSWPLNQLLVPLASPLSLLAEGSIKCCTISWNLAALTVDFRKHSGPTRAGDMAPDHHTTTTSMPNSVPDFVPDSGSFQMTCKIYFSQKRGHWTPEPQSFYLLSPGKMSRLAVSGSGAAWLEERNLKRVSRNCFCIVALVVLSPASVHSLRSSSNFLNWFGSTILSRLWLSLLLVYTLTNQLL